MSGPKRLMLSPFLDKNTPRSEINIFPISALTILFSISAMILYALKIGRNRGMAKLYLLDSPPARSRGA